MLIGCGQPSTLMLHPAVLQEGILLRPQTACPEGIQTRRCAVVAPQERSTLGPLIPTLLLKADLT